jgi:hypothetical protein
LSAGEFASLPRVTLPGTWSSLPSTMPRLVTPPAGGAVCAAGGEVVVGARPLVGAAAVGRSGSSADEISVPAGRGAVIAAMPAPDAPAGTLHVVTDLGVRHPVPSADVLPMLGYAGVQPVRLPAEIVALMPVGPALYPQAARKPLGG